MSPCLNLTIEQIPDEMEQVEDLLRFSHQTDQVQEKSMYTTIG